MQLAHEDILLNVPSVDRIDVQDPYHPDIDNRDASATMLGAAFHELKPAAATCRHFRNQVPREIADELRDNDPEACPVCDTMPHRSNRFGSVANYWAL